MVSVLALAYRNVVRQRRRSLIAVVAVAFGIASLILASGFIEWNLRFGRESTIHSQLGHIQISKRGYLDSGLSDPFAYLLPDNITLQHEIESLPHVRTLAPRLSFNGLISRGGSTISFIGEGVVPDREQDLSRSLTIVQGQGLSSGDSHGVIVGQGLAANLGVKPGDTVVLLATTPSGSINAVEGTVRGLFATVTKAYDDSAIRVPIVMARQLLRISGLHSYVLLLDKTENTDVVVSALRKLFHGQALEVIPWYRMADFYNKTAELFSRQVNFVRLIIAVIIVLSISNSMMMSVLERTSEIGTLTALGTRRSGILSLFLTEGVLLGILGGCLGLLLGYGAAQLISVIGIPMPPPPGMASGYTAEIMVTWPLALQAFALAVSTTLVASLFPAWKASRMNIVDSLRHSR